MTKPIIPQQSTTAGAGGAEIPLLGIRSVAVLLDEGRDLLVSARDRGERPERFVVEPEMLRELQSIRRVQVALTGGLAIFGLTVVAADDRPLSVAP
jgi:hypothetical protein